MKIQDTIEWLKARQVSERKWSEDHYAAADKATAIALEKQAAAEDTGRVIHMLEGSAVWPDGSFRIDAESTVGRAPEGEARDDWEWRFANAVAAFNSYALEQRHLSFAERDSALTMLDRGSRILADAATAERDHA